MHSVLSVTCAVFERPPAATGGGAAGGEGPTQKGASCGGGGEVEAACMQVEKDQRRKVCPMGGDHPHLDTFPLHPHPPSLTSPSLFSPSPAPPPTQFYPSTLTCPSVRWRRSLPCSSPASRKSVADRDKCGPVQANRKCGIGVGRPFFFHKMLPYQWVPDYQLVETREERCAICDSR